MMADCGADAHAPLAPEGPLDSYIVTSPDPYHIAGSLDMTMRIVWPGAPFSLITMDMPAGAMSLTVNSSREIIAQIRGSTATSVPLKIFYPGSSELEIRYAYEAANGGTQKLWLRSNGAYVGSQASAGQGGPSDPSLLAPTAVDQNDNLTFFESRSRAYVFEDCEFILLGDSTTHWGDNWGSIAQYIYASGERYTRAGICSLAGGGQRINAQKTEWDGSYFKGRSAVKAILIMVGINDIIAGATSTEILTDLQALIDDIAATNTTAKIVVAKIAPAGNYLSGAQRNVWKDANDGISALLGTHAVITSHIADLGEGANNAFLKAAYDGGDNLHPNNDARENILGVAYRSALVGLGLL